MQAEKLPFITVHQLPGEEEGVPAADLRIFCKDIRDHAVFIEFYDTSHNSQVPESLKKRTAEHDPCRACKAAQFVQAENLGDRSFPVAVVFKEETLLADEKDISDKELIDHSDDHSEDQEKSGTVPVLGDKV